MCTRTVSSFLGNAHATDGASFPATTNRRAETYNHKEHATKKCVKSEHFIYLLEKGESMSMQEFEQEEQEQPGQSTYQADYRGSYEAEQQKIHPDGGQRQGNALHIVAIVLSSLGFAFSVVGIVGSAIVLHAAQSIDGPAAHPELIAGGVLGLVSSILALLVFVAIFVVAIVLLAIKSILRRGAGRMSLHSRSIGSLGNLGW